MGISEKQAEHEEPWGFDLLTDAWVTGSTAVGTKLILDQPHRQNSFTWVLIQGSILPDLP